MNERRALHIDLNDLKAFVLLTAIKNQVDNELISKLSQNFSPKEVMPAGNQVLNISSIASNIVALHMKDQLNQLDFEKPENQRSCISRLSWAIQCGRTYFRNLVDTF